MKERIPACLEVSLDNRSLDFRSLEVIGELLERWLLGRQVGLLPQVGHVVSVGGLDGSENSLHEVTSGGGCATGAGKAVINTGIPKHLLRDFSGNDASTTGGWDQTDLDRTALARHLARNSVGVAKLGTPVSTHNRNDVNLGCDDGTTDGSGNFLGRLDTKTNMPIVVTNNDKSLEACTLTGSGLLLDWHDLHHLVLQGREEEINDLVLLDGHGEVVDVVNVTDFAVPDETSELGARDPLFLVLSLALALSLSFAFALSALAAITPLAAKSSFAS